MTTRRRLLVSLPTLWAAMTLGRPQAAAQQAATVTSPDGFWQSPSLTEETVVTANGAVTTRTAGVEANLRLGATGKSAAEVAPGVWLLSGWGLGHSMAIEAPEGWIVVDTGDSTATAADMRAHLERAAGGPIRVSAVLLTHWHYSDGTAAWLDEGADLWGHEHLDRNRTESSGASIASGFYRARAVAQFGVLHPTEGPDAFPNMMGFTPEKLLGDSSYMPPERLFADGRFETHVIAGETIEVGPNRSDTSDSVGFHFPSRRLLISNFMVPGFIFNIYSLRGGRFRDPLPFIEDCRWMESKGAEVLLDLHAAPVTGADAVRAAIQRSSDQVQLIHDQTLRMIARGLDGREASEAVYMPRHQRGHWESYGQVESHVRQVYSGTVGWFGTDVYDIAPLSLLEEAARTVAMMGGADAVRTAAADAAGAGGIANWQWALRLTSLLLRLDPADAGATATRATAARAIGQRTRSSNARGWYITEAMEREGALMALGKPVTLGLVRGVLGTPDLETLRAAPPDESLAFLRFLVDPRLAEDSRLEFTLAIEGEARPRSIVLRNGVVVVSRADATAALHAEVSRNDVAELILGSRSFAELAPALAAFEAVLDRSGFIAPPGALGPAFDDEAERDRIDAEGGH